MSLLQIFKYTAIYAFIYLLILLSAFAKVFLCYLGHVMIAGVLMQQETIGTGITILITMFCNCISLSAQTLFLCYYIRHI